MKNTTGSESMHKCETQITVIRICWSHLLNFGFAWLHLVDRPLCLLLSSASFLLLPPPQRSEVTAVFFFRVVIFFGMKAFLQDLISLMGCDELTTHPLFPKGCKGSLGYTVTMRKRQLSKFWAFDYIVGMQCKEEWSAPCSPSRSEYQVLESDLYLFPVSVTITVTKLNKQ